MADALRAPAGLVLDSVRVVDWTDQAGAYAGRLLADLGADVVRIEAPAGEADVWPEEAMTLGDGQRVSAFERYVNLNKRSVRVDAGSPGGQAVLRELLDAADVVITSGTPAREWEREGLSLQPGGTGTHVSVSPFGQPADQAGGSGRSSPQASAAARQLADDLVTLAAGGLLSLGGYPDTEPIAVYGSQAYLAGGISAAIAALMGLLASDAGQPQADIDVSIQAVMASALEDAAAEFDLTGVVRRRTGDGLREAGTGTFACTDGWIVVVAGKLGTAQAWDSLVDWLCEQDVAGAQVLKAPEWSTLEHRRRAASIETFQQIMESATARRTRQDLYAELQGRRIAAAPVNGIADLLSEPQLAAREFFRRVDDDVLDAAVTYPGPPYRLAEHQAREWSSAPVPGAQTAEVLEDWLGITDEQLTGLRRDGAIA